MIHVRDIRKAIEGLSDDAIVTAAFSTESSVTATDRFDLNLESTDHVDGYVVMTVKVIDSDTFTAEPMAPGTYDELY